MENKNESAKAQPLKQKDYGFGFLLAQTIACVIVFVFFAVIKQFDLPVYSDIAKWYRENLLQETSVATVENAAKSSKTKKASAQIKTVLTGTETPDSTSALKSESNSFLWPAAGEITSRFGERVDPFFNKTANHSGIDIAVNSGTEILCAANGIVQTVGYEKAGYGNYVIIEHSDGVKTVYAHCNSITVSEGQSVSRGDVIALSGSTGRSTGPHLHFEVRVNNTLLDPLWVLPLEYEI